MTVTIPDEPVTAEALAPGALSPYAAELVPIHRRQAGLPSRQEWVTLAGIANALANSEMIPKGLAGRPNNVMAVILKGRDLGLSPTEAVWGIHMIEGMPTLAAHTMNALIKRAGHRLWYEDSSRDLAVICAERLERWRSDGEPVYGPTVKITWTIQDAIDAKLVSRQPDGSLRAVSKDNKPKPWMLYPAAMLRARALTAIARMEFADVLMGAWYSPEELGAEVDQQGTVVRMPSAAEASRAFEELVARPQPSRRADGDAAAAEPVRPPQEALRDGEELSGMLNPDAPTVVDVEAAEPVPPPTRDELWAELTEQARVLAGGSLARHTARACASYRANAEDWTDEQLAEFVYGRRSSYERYIADHPEEAPVAPTAVAERPDVEVKPEDDDVAEESGTTPDDEQHPEPGEQRDSGLDGVEGDGLPGGGGSEAPGVTDRPDGDGGEPGNPSGAPLATPTEGDPATKREGAGGGGDEQDTLV